MHPFELVDVSRLCSACRLAAPPLVLVERVVARREQLRMTRNQLARRLGVHHQVIAFLETRQRRPTENMLRLLADWLNLSDDAARLSRYRDGWPEDLVEFGRLMTERRQAAGISLWALKVAAAVEWKTIQKLEQGRARWLRPATRRQIINALLSANLRAQRQG